MHRRFPPGGARPRWSGGVGVLATLGFAALMSIPIAGLATGRPVGPPAPVAAPSSTPGPVPSAVWAPALTSLGWFTGFPTFQITSGVPDVVLSDGFWGADDRLFSASTPALAAQYNQTGLQYVRWPGGAVADEYNYTANKVFRWNNQSYTPPTGFAKFAQWCGMLRCQAIVQLPGEIDDPATAAFYVHYIEKVVGFLPAYYEIGNEPALWRHFHVPWAKWNSTQRIHVNATQYAHVVQSYITAIRTVDPNARVLGLPGFGMGGYHEPTWIQASVAVNGPNLSGVSIHIYPSGRGPRSNPTLSAFYHSITGRGDIATRVPRDQAAILRGCATCTIPIFVTEMGAGNGGGSYSTFMRSYANVPFIGSELLQGMHANVSNIDLFSLQGRYPGSLVTGAGVLSPVGQFYASFLSHLGSNLYATITTGLAPGVEVAVMSGRAPGSQALLVISANTTTTQRVNLLGSGFYVGPGTVTTWNGTAVSPTATVYRGSVPVAYLVPPGGVLLVETSPQFAPGLPMAATGWMTSSAVGD